MTAGGGRGRWVVCLGVFGVWCSQEGGLGYLRLLIRGTARLFNCRWWVRIGWLAVGEEEGWEGRGGRREERKEEGGGRREEERRGRGNVNS